MLPADFFPEFDTLAAAALPGKDPRVERAEICPLTFGRARIIILTDGFSVWDGW